MANTSAWPQAATAVAAIATVGVTAWKNVKDANAERAANRVRAEEESLRRFDARLNSAIERLGSESPSLQTNAAAELCLYIKHRYRDFHTDLLQVLLANLKLAQLKEVGSTAAGILRLDLQQLLRLILADRKHYEDLPWYLDLSRASLRKLDISNLNLHDIATDVAFSDLSEARLAGANLTRLRGYKVNLRKAFCLGANLKEARLDHAHAQGALMDEATLVSATLRHANLTNVKFRQARMQEVQLERAKLAGADFTNANITNAYFRDATFDDAALETILDATGWDARNNAHRNFNDDVWELLQERKEARLRTMS